MDKNRLLKKLTGDTLVIAVKPPLLPLKGFFELIDWRLNSLLSRIIIEKKQEKKLTETILLPSKNKLPVEKVLVINFDNQTIDNMIKTLKGLKSKECNIVFHKDLKKELKTFFSDELKNNSFSWERTEEDLGDEILITLNKIQYV